MKVDMRKKNAPSDLIRFCRVCGEPVGKILKPQRGGFSMQDWGCEKHPDAKVFVKWSKK
jgi:hypothetical protein